VYRVWDRGQDIDCERIQYLSQSVSQSVSQGPVGAIKSTG
jgi:hypothetical protein